MSKKFQRTYTYTASVDDLWSMITDRGYWEAKYASLGQTNVTFRTFESSTDSFTYAATRDVPAELPSVAKKIVGEVNTVTTTERWTRAGDSASATIEIQVKNVPGKTAGSMTMSSSGDTSTWRFDLDTKVSVPLVGGKLESIMNEQTREDLDQEKVFNDSWLAGQR